ncbi:glycerophosphodiester phosphodiesterase [Paenibacillus thalictri]|uniref:Glycerophosphodiester phosphodiesterase n=1 Tax=Paenibacillus thalictri TaxID=2527873 RepID=A0A4Q9DSA0_9BACL|nr:glycerophosphodiester phosphodiesterase family protein [Paenibacillus thalictri]TBL78946.1 glycerophosphodiester phosphodiesterase [Paenibacillus thalictri]
MKKISGLAHRGYPGKAPENTLSSFQAACDLSYSHLELDVQLSKDGVPVVFHDYKIDRMSDGKGWVKDYTLEQLKQFRIGETETIPTLEETLQQLKGKIEFVIELKKAGEMYPTLEEATLDVIRHTDTLAQSRIISFDHFAIAKMRRLDPDIELGLLTGSCLPYVFPYLKEIRCTFLGFLDIFLTPAYAEMMRANGVVIYSPGVVDSIEAMQLMTDKYPDAVITTNELERWASMYLKRSEQ